MSEKEFKNYDFGKVIYDVSNGMYYSDLNTFKKQLRDAKVYRSNRYLKEAIETLINSQKVEPNNVEIREVELKVVNAYSYL
jgi:hypothetical protein